MSFYLVGDISTKKVNWWLKAKNVPVTKQDKIILNLKQKKRGKNKIFENSAVKNINLKYVVFLLLILNLQPIRQYKYNGILNITGSQS